MKVIFCILISVAGLLIYYLYKVVIQVQNKFNCNLLC